MMVSNYSKEKRPLDDSEEKPLPESFTILIKCLKLLIEFPEVLSQEQLILELLKISNTNLSENFCLHDPFVRIQTLRDNLTTIRQVSAESEEQLENISKRLESVKREKIKLREACDNILKVIGDNIDLSLKIASDDYFNSTKDEKLDPTHTLEKYFCDKLDKYMQELKKMSESNRSITAGIYVEGTYDQKGNTNHNHNYAPDKKLTEQELKEQVAELRQLVIQLQHDHQPTTENAAMKVIEAEFNEIEETNPSRWQAIQEQFKLLKRQAMNPERHFNATKEALSEVAKHYLEESVVAKALITYLNTMSADPTQGE